MTDIKLPELGESVTEGTITRWLKAVGDEIAVDEPIVEISTDKVDTEVPSPIAGTITEILAEEDDTVEVGAVIARVGDAGEAPAEEAPAEEAPAEEAAEAAQQAEEPAAETATEGTDSEADQEADEESAAEAQESPSKESEEQAAPAEAAQESAPAASGGQDITLPELGESVTEGTITRWLKAVGDEIAVDEPIVEISTDKVDTEVPSPIAGTITEILAEEDDTVEVGAVIARVGGQASSDAPAAEAPEAEPAKTDEPPAESTGSAEAQDAAPAEQPEPAKPSTEQPEPAKAEEPAEEPEPAAEAKSAEEAKPAEAAEPAEAPKAAPAAPAAPAKPAPPAPAAPAAPAASGSSAAYVTPIVRKLANEKGVDLGSLQGTGVGGRIRKEDVLAAAEAAPAAAPAAAAAAPIEAEVSELRGTTAKMSRLRKIVATRAVESMQTLAQLTTVVEVDVTKVAQLREAKKAAFQEETGNKLTFLPFFTQAAVQALKSHPLINATDDGETITYPATENLAMAVDTERGLLTPVIRDASSKSIKELTAEIADLAQRTRDNQLKPDELSGGTFTLTNTGSRGALFDTPVVFQPQRAILGVGTVVKRPVVVQVDGQDSIAIRSMVFLALSYDHRIIDGADAARYLGQVKAHLESGQFEV